MHRTPLFICAVVFFVVFSSINAWPRESLIATALHYKQSIVGIRALQATENLPIILDRETGKILIENGENSIISEKKGAGVILDTSGIIATNLHNLIDANQIIVKLHNNESYSARFIELLPGQDLALIKIDAPFPLTPIEFADSQNLKLGEAVINIGSSELLKETISGGKVTMLGTNKKNQNIEVIEINMHLGQGDSGGPLLDQKGRLVGMIHAKHNVKQRSVFAIPSNKIKKLYLNYKK